ncbi:hypothetical protein Scep_010688 [Stephania cephalantha]|uniref:Uncharacterized protein n=1 Tax=Stephania cephalantha TaxID=152367 RepID=A0AAP0PEF2_9MAGN
MAETVTRSSGSRADGERRDSGEGRRGARGRAAAARHDGVLTAATVGSSTGEGLASLQHDRAMADAAPAGGRTVGSSGGPVVRTTARGAATTAIEGSTQGDSERAAAGGAARRLSSGVDGRAASAAPSNGARMARRDDNIVRRKENKERSFARHESSKGEFELMTPLKEWIELILNDIRKSKEEIRRFENAFWIVGRPDRGDDITVAAIERRSAAAAPPALNRGRKRRCRHCPKRGLHNDALKRRSRFAKFVKIILILYTIVPIIIGIITVENYWLETTQGLEVLPIEPNMSIAPNDDDDDDDVVLEIGGVEVKEHSRIFYTADTFVLDDHDSIDSFVLEIPNELRTLKEGVHAALPKYVDAPFVVDISKGEGIT